MGSPVNIPRVTYQYSTVLPFERDLPHILIGGLFRTHWYYAVYFSIAYYAFVRRTGAVAAGVAAGGATLIYALERSVHASSDAVHPFHLPWSHSGPFSSFDIASYVDDGKAYNPYFPGGIISMPQQLFDEGIEYKI
uniref:Phospholipid methyltransferase n=1 Tax=Heterorhabditis bacteriophora TaxID=37862 RepID=A0A1I7WFY4_HETBA